jgi:hypothetical protein
MAEEPEVKDTSERGLLFLGSVAAIISAHETGVINEVDVYQYIENALDEYFLDREMAERGRQSDG